MIDAIKDIVKNISAYEKDYSYSSSKNEFFNIKANGKEKEEVNNWFEIPVNSTKT